MRRFILLLLLVVGCAAPVALSGQTNPQIQIAINNLITGVTPFSTLRLVASAYQNWGTTTGVNGYGLRDNAGVIEAKNSGGSWLPLPTSSSLPTAAPFITRTPDGNLSNETALSALATALIVNTTATGVPTAYAGTSCTNLLLTALAADGTGTCGGVNLGTMVLGTTAVANGGTGLTSGTSGGVLAFTASGTLASSGALTANQIVLGGGAGVAPTVLGSLGTTTTLLHGNAGGAPTFGAAVLTTDVSGILPTANGGTANAFFTVAGPAASAKTYTFPNASTTVLTTNTAITAAQGGTGQTAYTIGDLLYASGATALSKLADGSTGNALIAGGVGVAPSYGKIGLTTHISGTLGATNGGTGIASYTTGDLLTASSGTTLVALADVAAGRFLRSVGVGSMPAYSTTIWTNAATTGDLLYASAANTYSNLADVAVGQVLTSGGVGVAPAWSDSPRVTNLLLGANVALSATAPTISSGFGTGAAITAGTASSFRVDIGTGGIASAGVIGMPTATTGWNCHVEDLTATTANAMDARTVQLSSTVSTVTVENQTVSLGSALVWTANDVLSLVCVAY